MKDVEKRAKALELHRAFRAAESYVGEVEENSPRLTAEQYALIDKINEEYEEKIEALNELRRVKIDAISERVEVRSARDALTAALGAYNEFDSPAIAEDNHGEALICAKSGVAIWEEEQIVEDPETDEVFLREALGLPPRKIDDEAEAA